MAEEWLETPSRREPLTNHQVTPFEQLLRDTPSQDDEFRLIPGRVWTMVSWGEGDIRHTSAGWKLHVAARPPDALEILGRVWEVLRRRRCEFKFARSTHELDLLNTGLVGSTQVGKFITVYPRTPDERAVDRPRAPRRHHRTGGRDATARAHGRARRNRFLPVRSVRLRVHPRAFWELPPRSPSERQASAGRPFDLEAASTGTALPGGCELCPRRVHATHRERPVRRSPATPQGPER